MENLIHMTAAYSNAVLLIVMTNVSDFAKKLELPIPTPITTNHVQKFTPLPVKHSIGGALFLTNGDRFFQHGNGYINGFYSAQNYYTEQEFDEASVSKYYGRMNMTTNEVIEFARDALRKLGYDPKKLSADGPPTSFSFAGVINGHMFPFCDMEWEGPDKENWKNKIRISINAEKKQVVGLSIISPSAWRPSPKLNIEPELESEYQKRMKGKMFLRTNAPELNSRPDPSAKKSQVITNQTRRSAEPR